MASTVTDEDLGSADLLALMAPPLRITGGPDFILLKRAPGPIPVAGATIWLQNPTNSPMEVRFSIRFDDVPVKLATADRFVGTLAPLEVGVLAVPMSIRFTRPHRLKFMLMGPYRGPFAPRVRATTMGHLDREKTLKGIATGLAGLALIGVGQFTFTHVGGDVGDSFHTTWDVQGADPGLANAKATWTRLWAPVGTLATAFVHEAEPPRTVETTRRGVDWVTTLPAFVLAGLGYMTAAPTVDVVPSIALAVFLLFGGAYGANKVLRIALPGLFPKDTIGSLVLQDGEGITPA